MVSERIKELSYEHPIIIFDGKCLLCSRIIRFFIKYDTDKILRYTTTQHENIDHYQNENADTGILVDNGIVYTFSDFPIYAIRHLKMPLSMLYYLKWFPKPVRDAVYRWVARNRRRLFGRSDVCMIPDDGMKERFL